MTAHGFANCTSAHVLGNDTLRLTDHETQRLVVLARPGGVSPQLAEICDALDIERVDVASHHDLPLRLHHHRPMGVVSELDPHGAGCSAALRSIAAYDPTMPVLLVEGCDPAVLGAIDVAEQLWGLSALHRIEASPSLPELMGFLFQAGRRGGMGRLMPVGPA